MVLELQKVISSFISRCDVAQESDWESIWSHTEKAFNGKVQILVNNAGVNPARGWKMCMDIMIYGVMMGSYLARDKMGATKVIAKQGVKEEHIIMGFFGKK